MKMQQTGFLLGSEIAEATVSRCWEMQGCDDGQRVPSPPSLLPTPQGEDLRRKTQPQRLQELF